MSPTLADGDFVVVVGRLSCVEPRVGAVVLVRHPVLGPLIKRIASRDAVRRVTLTGDNDLSMASEQIGPLVREAIVGTVWLRVARSGAITRVR